MLPRLDAEETLNKIHAGMMSSGLIRKPDLRRALTKLEKTAGGGKRSSVKATPNMLASAGIAVVIVEEPAPEVVHG